MKLIYLVILISILNFCLTFSQDIKNINKEIKQSANNNIIESNSKNTESKKTKESSKAKSNNLMKVKEVSRKKESQIAQNVGSEFNYNVTEYRQDVYRIQIYEGSNKLIEGDFDTASVLAPKYDKGLYMRNCSKFDKNNSVSNEILVKDRDNYYLPFLALSEFTFTDPWFSNKYFYTIFKGENTTYNVYIYFPYSLLGWEIPNKLCIDVKNKLNIARTTKISYVNTIKSDANKIASNYMMSQNMLKGIEANLSQEKRANDLKVEIDRITALMKAEVTDLQGSNDRLQEIVMALQKEQTINNSIKGRLDQLGENKNILIKAYNGLQKGNASAKSQEADLKIIITKLEGEYSKDEQILIREAPNSKNIIQTARNELFVYLDLPKMQEKLNAIAA